MKPSHCLFLSFLQQPACPQPPVRHRTRARRGIREAPRVVVVAQPRTRFPYSRRLPARSVVSLSFRNYRSGKQESRNRFNSLNFSTTQRCRCAAYSGNTPCWEASGSTALVAWRGDRANREIASQHSSRTSGSQARTLRREAASFASRSGEGGDSVLVKTEQERNPDKHE